MIPFASSDLIADSDRKFDHNQAGPERQHLGGCAANDWYFREWWGDDFGFEKRTGFRNPARSRNRKVGFGYSTFLQRVSSCKRLGRICGTERYLGASVRALDAGVEGLWATILTRRDCAIVSSVATAKGLKIPQITRRSRYKPS